MSDIPNTTDIPDTEIITITNKNISVGGQPATTYLNTPIYDIQYIIRDFKAFQASIMQEFKLYISEMQVASTRLPYDPQYKWQLGDRMKPILNGDRTGACFRVKCGDYGFGSWDDWIYYGSFPSAEDCNSACAHRCVFLHNVQRMKYLLLRRFFDNSLIFQHPAIILDGKNNIPSNWADSSPENIELYLEYLLENSKYFQPDCTPYDEKTDSGLIVTMSRDDLTIQISRAHSPKRDSSKRGRQAKPFGIGDYVLPYNAYIINGRLVSIVGDTEQECNLANQVHQLYLKMRSKTIPTSGELYQRKIDEKAQQPLKNAAQQTLLDTMKRNGDITLATYKKYAGDGEQIPETMGPRIYVEYWGFNQKGDVLMGKRQTDPGRGTYAVPGGYLNFGESPEHAAMRVLFEETGIKIEETDLMSCAYTFDKFYDKHHNLKQHHMTLHYIGKYAIEQTPRAMNPDTCKKWTWFDTDKLPSRLFLPTKHGWPLIQLSR